VAIEMGNDWDGLKRSAGVLEVKGGNPDTIKRFVNKDKGNIARKRMMGYDFVDRKDVEVPGATVEQFGDNTSSRVEVGDLVLMEIPKEVYDERQKMKTQRRRARSKSVKENFHTEGQRAGVQTEEGYEDPSRRR
jgi:hypothetical protein